MNCVNFSVKNKRTRHLWDKLLLVPCSSCEGMIAVKPTALSMIADTGWWSQKTATWWRAGRSLVWCWCLWPARAAMSVWTGRTWRSCSSPSDSPIVPSSTAGFTLVSNWHYSHPGCIQKCLVNLLSEFLLLLFAFMHTVFSSNHLLDVFRSLGFSCTKQ